MRKARAGKKALQEIARLSIAAALLAGIVHRGQLVLCDAGSGHLQVEPTFLPCCEPCGPEPAGKQSLLPGLPAQEGEGSCQDCTDYPLSRFEPQILPRPQEPPAAPGSALPASFDAGAPLLADPHPDRGAPSGPGGPSISSCLLHLRTVVLLI